MERELEKLKKEISVLQGRVRYLEGKEHKREVTKSIKFLFNVIIIAVVLLSAWKAYDYVTNYIPNYLQEQIDKLNPFN